VPPVAALTAKAPRPIRLPAGSAGHVHVETYNTGNVPLIVTVSAHLPTSWRRSGNDETDKTILLGAGQGTVLPILLHASPSAATWRMTIPFAVRAEIANGPALSEGNPAVPAVDDPLGAGPIAAGQITTGPPATAPTPSDSASSDH